MKKQYIGEVDAEKVAEWKAKHKDIYSIVVDGHICYLRKPDRKILSYAAPIGAKDPIKFNEILLANCWLGGSEEIKTSDDLFLGASAKVADLIEVKEAELVKL